MQQVLDQLRIVLERLSAYLDARQASTQQPKTVPSVIETPQPVPVTPPAAKGPTIADLALAIRDYEGSPGDANYRNNNPGNCRYSQDGYLPMYEPVKCSPVGFAIFKDYATGWLYLNNLLRAKIHTHPNQTLLQFMQDYAPPGDRNNPVEYSASIGVRLKVDYKSFLVKNFT